MSAVKKNRFRLPMANCRFFGFILMLACLVAWTTPAQQLFYFNNAVVTDPEPIPDATNFINNSSYTVTFPEFALYKTHDTLNYTNNGFMESFYGFDFDNYSSSSGLDSEAGSFDNENTIECEDQCIVWATNIVNPGYVAIDSEGLALFEGGGVDMSYTTLSLGGGSGLTPGFANPNGIDEGTGTDTQGDWQPSMVLTSNSATSSDFNSTLVPAPIKGNNLVLNNSKSYFTSIAQSTNSTIYRFAFVQNENPNTPYNVYFGAPPQGVGGAGFTTIEWTGLYTNYSTGQILTNYLYLNALPEPIVTNGEKVIGGIPNTYTFTGSATELETPPGVSNSYQDVFNTGIVTDNYSYVEATLIPTTVGTNDLTGTNVSAIAGRVEISAGQELNLNQAQISGENYINLTATNQFDGNGGAIFTAPYADVAIGVTNGNLTVSNLFLPAVPVWGGTIQAWATDWTNANTTTGSNADYRVVLVDANISPTTSAQVQNLTLLGTNSVVISDILNVYGSMFINAQSLTLTTNGIGNGAASLEGVLNVENNNILFPSALPNLHWLTNNGAITLGNLSEFGAASDPYGAFVNNGSISDQGSQIYANYFENSGLFNNGEGSFVLNSETVELINGEIFDYFPFPTFIAGGLNGNIFITANTLVASNVIMEAGGGLILNVTNQLTDSGVTNGLWASGGGNLVGLQLPIKPATGDLLGTKIILIAPANKPVKNVWAGQDFGDSNSGYNNNEAIGQLTLDVTTSGSSYSFSGVSNDNGMYVDQLVLDNFAALTNNPGRVISQLNINTNLVIYYADAQSGGSDVSSLINGFNNNHLVWVSTYTGIYSSIKVVNADRTTNTMNLGVASPPQAPAFSASSGANGQFHLTVSGNSAYLAVVQSSTNLVNWVNISTNIPPFTYTDTVSSSFPSRFYRALVQ